MQPGCKKCGPPVDPYHDAGRLDVSGASGPEEDTMTKVSHEWDFMPEDRMPEGED